MIQERVFGLQWRLSAILLAVALGSPAVVAAGCLAGVHFGLGSFAALGMGCAAGVILGLAGAVLGSLLVRSVKLRLWEAGRMAGSIARGEFRARISPGPPDEVGWLEEQLNWMAGHLEEAVSELRLLAEQNRRLGVEAGRGAALEVRASLARDLHDTVNQQLFALALRSAAARRMLDDPGNTGAAAAVSAELSAMEELAREAHSRTRELILQLRPVTLEQHGLGSALEEYATAMAAREGWDIDLDIDRHVRIEEKNAENLFRIAQEALHNSAKHARAGQIWIKLSRIEGGMELAITDNGDGFDLQAAFRPAAVGLAGIRERTAALGGICRIESAPGSGTKVIIVAPAAGGGEC